MYERGQRECHKPKGCGGCRLVHRSYHSYIIYGLRTWLKDQNLHPDEPVHVDAVYRQLNPVRILYRWPWDKLYEHFLRPTFVGI